MDKKRQELLHTPEGMWDRRGKDFIEYKAVADAVGSVFHSYGYQDIRTPSIEFFDVFSREIGTTPSRELYKFFDKENNTLVLRPDFTPSVARCAAKYYMDDSEPLRFCYEGSAFINSSSLQGKLRERAQLGAELVNEASVYADAEMLSMLKEALCAAGLTRFQITVGNVEYFKGICEAAGLSSEEESELRDYISAKNYYAAQALLDGMECEAVYREQFLRITSFLKSREELEQVRAQAPNERSKTAVERLISLSSLLEAYGAGDFVSFDLSLLSRYQYYTGIIFKAYTYGVGEAVATGGRYDRLLAQFGKEAAAIGFMIGQDTLMDALRVQKIKVCDVPEALVICCTAADFAARLEEAKALRAEGKAVVLQVEET